MKRLKFQAGHWETMLAHVARCSPEEACGLVAGEGESVRIVFPMTNRAHSPSRFEMDPQEQLKVFNRIDEDHLQLLGIYHSHPAGPGFPSETDIRSFSYPGVASIIWTGQGDQWAVNGFMIEGESYLPVVLDFPGSSNPA